MKLPSQNSLFVMAIIILGATLGISRWQLHRAQRAGENNALRADSTAAVLDTTRSTALSAKYRAKILGDSLAAVERRAVQLAKGPARDDFDRATDRTSVARGSVTLNPGRIDAQDSAPSTVEIESDVRSARFHIDSSRAIGTARFTADVAVDIPRPPALATLRLGVSLPPIELEPRIQCGPPDPGGIRPASLAVIAPRGVDVTVGRFDVDVRACNPEFGRPRGIRVPLWVAGAGAGLGFVVGVLIAH